jgi:adenylate cyclase
LTPEHLAAKIRASRRMVEGERKQVTVLFADVKGSMELGESMDAEEWRRIMERFFVTLCEGVHRFEGTIDKFTGDGIMALFGAPIAHEDHARRACYAALHLGQQLSSYAAELRREHGLNFSVRIGLNSGEVVVGTIGSDLRLDYTAIGHTVGLAQRIEQLAEPGKAYLTEHTAALVKGFFELVELGQFDLKGVREPLSVYELTGVGPARTRLDVSRVRGFSRFTGRDDELAVLDQALARAVGGDGQIIGVVGEPGLGKSRLCFELAERCRMREITVIEASGVAHGKQVPLLPILELLRGSFGITDHDRDQAAREKIAGRLLLLDEGFQAELPLVFDLLGVADPERPSPQMDPEARQRRLFEIGRRMVTARSRREPSVILLEDLHWIDDASGAFLANLVEAVEGTRTLLLLNYRPEYGATWMDKPYFSQLALMPLGPTASDALLGDLLGDDPLLRDLRDLIRERTGGNPFFIEEVVQALVGSGALVGERGVYALIRPVGEVSIPPTVEAVLAARIDRLNAASKSVLQTAAVIGGEFSEPVLRKVWELPAPDLAVALSALVDAGFLYELALYPAAEFAFKHPLTREVAYRSQLADQRAPIHAAAAHAIAELYPDKLDERAALLAVHWERAGEPIEAARWSARAGEWAGPIHPAEALRHWRRVRELLDDHDETAETIGLRLAACAQLLSYSWRMGISDQELAETLTEAKALASRNGDLRTLARATGAYGTNRLLTGELDEWLANRAEVERLVSELGDPEFAIAMNGALATGLWFCGDVRGALEAAEEMVASTRDDPTFGKSIWGFSGHILNNGIAGVMLAMSGHVPEGASRIERAIELAREHHEIEALGYAYSLHGWIPWISGERKGAIERGREGVEIAERLGNAWSRTIAWAQLARAHLICGNPTDAFTAAEHALDVARERGIGLASEAVLLGIQSEALLARGEVERARALGQQGVEAGQHHRTPVWECLAQLALARACLAAGREHRSEIAATLAHAQQLVDQTGALALKPFIHAQLAELARATGDYQAHERELREAQRLFTAIGAPRRAAELAPTYAT